jgi:hypothetical protein
LYTPNNGFWIFRCTNDSSGAIQYLIASFTLSLSKEEVEKKARPHLRFKGACGNVYYSSSNDSLTIALLFLQKLAKSDF